MLQFNCSSYLYDWHAECDLIDMFLSYIFHPFNEVHYPQLKTNCSHFNKEVANWIFHSGKHKQRKIVHDLQINWKDLKTFSSPAISIVLLYAIIMKMSFVAYIFFSYYDYIVSVVLIIFKKVIAYTTRAMVDVEKVSLIVGCTV